MCTEVIRLAVKTEKDACKLPVIVNATLRHSGKVNSPLLLPFPCYSLPNTGSG